MTLNVNQLPTPLALVARRLAATGAESSADSFLMASYVAEAAIKHLAVVLQAGLIPKGAQPHAYRLAYSMLRADGLGIWEAVIRESLQTSVTTYFPSDFLPLLQWLSKNQTKEHHAQFENLTLSLREVVRIADIEDSVPRTPRSFRDIITIFVILRNKTRAHGALGEDFFVAANPHFINAVNVFVTECPVFLWKWLFLSRRDPGTVRAICLQGTVPTHLRDAEATKYEPPRPGLYCQPTDSQSIFYLGDLLLCDRECREFLLPNGNFKQDGTAEFIDYATGRMQFRDASHFLVPPAPLPFSETHGFDVLDIHTNVFGNLPPLPVLYVHRNRLETELMERLKDRNHTIITLHGRGGVGKTYLALHAAHSLAQETCPVFDHIVWFSARDVDLRPSGPVPVKQAVSDLRSVSLKFGAVFGVDGTPETFSEILRDPGKLSACGFLFIFDNFETLSDAAGLHRFLDVHTHIPNKVLITSRERSFKADFPIEVCGMEFPEAREMLVTTARELGVEPILTDDVVRKIHDYAEGHAYVMRLLVGEIAKERRYIPPHTLVPRKENVIQALFERSFNRLSDTARRLFLAIANWQSAVWEATLLVVFSQRGLDVESGVEECVRLSLLVREREATGHAYYVAPQLARVFAKKKLEGDPDRLLILEDLEVLKKFGPVSLRQPEVRTFRAQADTFLSWCNREAQGASGERISQLDRLIQTLANLVPDFWLEVARFRKRNGLPLDSVGEALRRAVEEQPFRKDAWLARATHAEDQRDEALRLACLVSAVDTDPADVVLIRDVALDLCKYVSAHSSEIPTARRGVYLASVREHMEKVSGNLDGTGLSRLAWLFLLEGQSEKARHYAELGCERDPFNQHCLKILERLEGGTWS